MLSDSETALHSTWWLWECAHCRAESVVQMTGTWSQHTEQLSVEACKLAADSLLSVAWWNLATMQHRKHTFKLNTTNRLTKDTRKTPKDDLDNKWCIDSSCLRCFYAGGWMTARPSAHNTSTSKTLGMAVNINGWGTAWRVLACPVRMLRMTGDGE